MTHKPIMGTNKGNPNWREDLIAHMEASKEERRRRYLEKIKIKGFDIQERGSKSQLGVASTRGLAHLVAPRRPWGWEDSSGCGVGPPVGP